MIGVPFPGQTWLSRTLGMNYLTETVLFYFVRIYYLQTGRIGQWSQTVSLTYRVTVAPGLPIKLTTMPEQLLGTAEPPVTETVYRRR